MSFHYVSTQVPDNYACAGCGRKGIKLWRPYQSPADSLLCAGCSAAEQRKDISTMRADGSYRSDITSTFVDSIGWRAPAVPTEADPHAFWGYQSIPPEAYAWWAALPN